MEDVELRRIDYKYVRNEVFSLLNLHKRFLYSISTLILNPGKGIRCFIQKDRKKMMKPIMFLALASLFFLIIVFLTGAKYSFLKFEGFSISNREYETGELANFLNSNIVYLNLLFVLFSSIWSKIIFRNSKYNIFEIVVSFCYIFGEALFIISIPLAIIKLLDIHIDAMLLWIPYFIYLLYGLESFFADEGNRLVNAMKVLAVYAFGFITYLMFMILYTIINT